MSYVRYDTYGNVGEEARSSQGSHTSWVEMEVTTWSSGISSTPLLSGT